MTLTLSGVRLVAVQEFRLRLRAGRWRWLLGAWFLVLLLFTTLLNRSLATTGSPADEIGPAMFGGLMLFLLGLALLVAPALSAQSINGDRDRGTLATVQVTLLSPAEIAIGKLVAAWGTALVFLAVSLPMVAWCVAEGGVGGARAIVVLLVVGLLLGVVCAVAEALSAVLRRGTTSAVLSYLVVFALTIGTLITFGLVLSATSESRVETDGGSTYETTEVHPERVWWILAPNPFVILADSAPAAPTRRDPRTNEVVRNDFDPLNDIGDGVRELRKPPTSTFEIQPEPTGGPVWPYGLAFNLGLGVIAVVVAARQLRAPTRSLPRGARVA
jgi:ABC-type transport system involved in multi-copper enzyme maturation permease subunit